MQPYFFPYLGHFALITSVDKWIVFDVTQYTKKSWINRNRILSQQLGWQYISAPLEKSTTTQKIYDAEIKDRPALHGYIAGKLSHYKKYAPHFNEVMSMVDNIFADVEDDSLVLFNVTSLSIICRYLNIPFHYEICSSLKLHFPDYMAAGDWAPFIAHSLKASTYINPIGGIELFKKTDFEDNKINLCFMDFNNPEYPTTGYTFEPGLSILDVMMWNSPKKINEMIKKNTIFIDA